MIEAIGWSAALLNVLGNLMLTGRDRKGWLVRLAVNALWLPYAFAVPAWPLAANHIAFAAINVAGWWRWRPRPEVCPTCGETRDG